MIRNGILGWLFRSARSVRLAFVRLGDVALESLDHSAFDAVLSESKCALIDRVEVEHP